MIGRLRGLAFSVLFYAWTIAAALLASPTLLLPLRYGRGSTRVYMRGVAWLERAVLGLTWELRGLEHLPEGAAIIAAQHQSTFETLKLLRWFGRPLIVLKAELAALPIIGGFVTRLGGVPIDRSQRRQAAALVLEAAQAAAAEGRKIVIFPQGTRVPPGEHAPYQPGVARLYDALKLPVVPVALTSGRVWPRGFGRGRPGHVVVEMLPAIPPGLPRARLMRELEAAIEGASARLLAEPTPGSVIPAEAGIHVDASSGPSMDSGFRRNDS